MDEVDKMDRSTQPTVSTWSMLSILGRLMQIPVLVLPDERSDFRL